MGVEELAGAGAGEPWLKRWLETGGAAEPRNYATLPAQPGGLLRALWRGGLPGLLDLPDEAVQPALGSYLRTYVERDAPVVREIRDGTGFSQFTALCAALTAQEINRAQFGREIGVAPLTAKTWLGLLRATYQWHELPAFSGNTLKRISGKPKGHFADTGMACLLQRLASVEALSVSPLRGALFETFVVNGLRKQFATLPAPPALSHWRTNGGAEVDAVLEWNGARWLVEVKCKTEITGHDLRGIRAFRDTYETNAPAVVVYAGAVIQKWDERTLLLPWNAVANATPTTATPS